MYVIPNCDLFNMKVHLVVSLNLTVATATALRHFEISVNSLSHLHSQIKFYSHHGEKSFHLCFPQTSDMGENLSFARQNYQFEYNNNLYIIIVSPVAEISAVKIPGCKNIAF
jgi:hypothetical protein